MIRLLEELSLNAWPALQTLVVDGWLVRFADGYTRRANSVQPLYAPQGDVEANIAACEALYTARGLPTIFKLTPASEPGGLDDLLRERGYARQAETSVQTLALGEAASRLQGAPTVDGPAAGGPGGPAARAQPRDQGAPAKTGARAPAARAAPTPSLYAAPHINDDWFEAFLTITEPGLGNHQTAWLMLRDLSTHAAPKSEQPALKARFAYLLQGKRSLACGLAVAERGYVGCFDIATHPRYRRQGHARRLMQDLLGWGREQGAHTAYLQVMSNNDAALGLYEGLGYREAYRYWYRVRRE